MRLVMPEGVAARGLRSPARGAEGLGHFAHRGGVVWGGALPAGLLEVVAAQFT
jgi:hypothetical protein